MARHRTPEEKRELGERARALRAAGRSRAQIRTELGISDDLAKAFLQGTTVPDALRRPNAKDDLREAALALRRQGATYDQISAELGVSKSTCSLWLRSVPVPASPGPAPAAAVIGHSDPDTADDPGRRRLLARELRGQGMVLRDIADRLGVSAKTIYYDTLDMPLPARGRRAGRSPEALRADVIASWARRKEARRLQREATEAEHAASVGPHSREALHLMAVTAYWCEGTKSKPWAEREQVTFINSDIGLIRLWLAYLDDVCFPDPHRKLSVAIHESADVDAAERSWAADLGIPAERLLRPTLKRHNPTTVRHNTGEEYRGCLIVRLTQCVELYRRISGTWTGIMGVLPPTCAQVGVG